MPFLSELFQAIRERPGLYFGDSPPLSALYFFIQGSCLGRKRDESPPLSLPHDFEGWVAYRIGASRSLNWLGMVLSVSADEHEAFGRFFELLEEYDQRRRRVIARITRHGKVRQLSVGEQPLPDPILLTTYTDDPGFLATDTNGICFGTWGYWKSWDEMSEREGFDPGHVEVLDEGEFLRVQRTALRK